MRRILIGLGAVAALHADAAEQQSVLSSVNGWGMLTMGRFVRTFDTTVSENIQGEYYVDFHAGLRIIKLVGAVSRARVHVAGQIASYLDLPGQAKADHTRWRFVPYPVDLALESNFPLGAFGSVQTELGYFPVRYNPQARNLGEYLFRSWAYPPILVSGFESADKVKQLGTHFRWTFGREYLGDFRQDFYASSELDLYPTHDISLSALTGYTSPGRLLDVGAGVNLAHAVALSPERITPGTYTDNVGRPRVNLFNEYSYIDTVADDTTHYTFRGLKAMGRFTLDPKVLFFPGATTSRVTRLGHLSAEDLKLYVEVAVLGVRDYQGWYEDVLERMPVMAGVNIPTIGLLDVLSVEVQWYGSKYRNSPYNAWGLRIPAPYATTYFDEKETWKAYTEDDWKWSIYGTRTVSGTVRLSLGFQSDHLQATALHNPFPYFKFYDIVLRTEDWYWMARVSYLF